MLEALSGKRLYSLFVIVFATAVAHILLIVLPFRFGETQLHFAIGFILASQLVFASATFGFTSRVSVKAALIASMSVLCVYSLRGLENSPTMASGEDDYAFYLLIVLQPITMLVGGVLYFREQGFNRGSAFGVSDLMIGVTTFAVLFPLVYYAWPKNVDGQLLIWPDNYSEELSVVIFLAAVNCGCCFFVLWTYVEPEDEPRKHRGTIKRICFTVAIVVAITAWSFVSMRLTLGIWIVIMSLPVIGMKYRRQISQT